MPRSAALPSRFLSAASLLGTLVLLPACRDTGGPSEAVATRLDAVSIPTVIEQVGTLTTVVVRTTTPSGEAVGNVGLSVEPSATTQVIGSRSPVTDARGEARIQWDLGTRSGDVTLLVKADGISPITIRGVLLPGPAAALKLEVPPQEVDMATAVGLTPAVRVVDRYGNGVPSREVTFAVTRGGGQITNPIAYSDLNGDVRAKGWTTGLVGYDQDLLATLKPDGGGFPVTLAVPVRGKMAWRSGSWRDDSGPSGWYVRLPALDASIDPRANSWVALGFDVPDLALVCSRDNGYRTYIGVGALGRSVNLEQTWIDDEYVPIFDPPTNEKVRTLVGAQRMRIRFTPYQRSVVVEASFVMGGVQEQLRRTFPSDCLAHLGL
jgi:hypothetical protein